MNENKKWILECPTALNDVGRFGLQFESELVEECIGWNKTRIKCYLVDLQDNDVLYETEWYDTTGCSYSKRSGHKKCFLDAMTRFSEILI